jgi:hypothetical protein
MRLIVISKKKFRKLYYYIFEIFDFLLFILLVPLLIIPLLRKKKLSSAKIFSYIPSGASGWILESIWHDLSLHSDKPTCVLKRKYSLILQAVLNNSNVYFMHYLFIPRGFKYLKFAFNHVGVLYTHTRLNSRSIGSLELADEILVMNSYEYEFLVMNGDYKNVKKFPVGFREDLFKYIEFGSFKKNKYDFLINMRFTSSYSSYYAKRKRFEFVFSVLQKLSQAGYSVLVLGPGWEGIDKSNLYGCTFVDINYSDYSLYISQASCFLMLSALEGGPISYYDALSQGLSIITTPTGFALDYIYYDLGVEFISFENGADEIIEIYEGYKSSIFSCGRLSLINKSRKSILKNASFMELSKLIFP